MRYEKGEYNDCRSSPWGYYTMVRLNCKLDVQAFRGFRGFRVHSKHCFLIFWVVRGLSDRGGVIGHNRGHPLKDRITYSARRDHTTNAGRGDSGLSKRSKIKMIEYIT